MGMKQLQFDDGASDRELELEDDLPYEGAIEVNQPMMEMIAKLDDDDEWLPWNEQRMKDAKIQGEIICPYQEIEGTHRCQGKRKSHSHGPDIAAKLKQVQWHPKHIRAMKNQAKLTTLRFQIISSHLSALLPTSISSSHTQSIAASGTSSRGPSCVSSVTPSPLPSPIPSPEPPAGLPIASSLEPPMSLLSAPSPVGVSESRSAPDDETLDPSEKDDDWEDDDKEDGNKEGGNKDGKKKDNVDSEDEEDNTDSFMEAGVGTHYCLAVGNDEGLELDETDED